MWISSFSSCKGRQWILKLPRLPSDLATEEETSCLFRPQCPCVCLTPKQRFVLPAGAQHEIKALGHSQQNKRVKPKESKRQRKGLRDKDQPQIWYFIQIRSGAEVQFKVHKTKIQKRSAPRFCCSLSLQVYSDIPIFQATKASPVLCKTMELISSPAPGYASTQICISGISNILTQP